MKILEYNIGTGARAFSTMRGGGSGNYGGFNITHYCGDRPPTADGDIKWHIDLWEANRLQLVECGVNDENIQMAGICTYTRHEEFFSARRLGIESGRIFNGIMIETVSDR